MEWEREVEFVGLQHKYQRPFSLAMESRGNRPRPLSLCGCWLGSK